MNEQIQFSCQPLCYFVSHLKIINIITICTLSYVTWWSPLVHHFKSSHLFCKNTTYLLIICCWMSAIAVNMYMHCHLFMLYKTIAVQYHAIVNACTLKKSRGLLFHDTAFALKMDFVNNKWSVHKQVLDKTHCTSHHLTIPENWNLQLECIWQNMT